MGTAAAIQTETTSKLDKDRISEVSLPKTTTQAKAQAPIPGSARALSMESEVLPFVRDKAQSNERVIFLLRAPSYDSHLSPSEQPMGASSSEQKLGVLITGIAGLEQDKSTGQTVLLRRQTLTSEMLNLDPALKLRVFGEQGVLAQTLDERGFSSAAISSFELIDPFSGFPYPLKVRGDKLLETSNLSSYQVIGLSSFKPERLSIDAERHKARLLEHLGPSSPMEEKVSAMVHLTGDEQAQLALLRKIEPFYLTNELGDVKARYGQFPQEIVEQFFTGRAQYQAYIMGMIAFPERKYVCDDNGVKYYSPEYADAIKRFYLSAKMPVLKLQLENNYPGFLAQNTSQFELFKYNTTVAIPEGVSSLSKQGAEKAKEAASAVGETAFGVVSEVKNQAKRAVVDRIHEAAAASLQRIVNKAWELLSPRSFY